MQHPASQRREGILTQSHTCTLSCFKTGHSAPEYSNPWSSAKLSPEGPFHPARHSGIAKSLLSPGKQEAWKFFPAGNASQQKPVPCCSDGAGQTAVSFILTARSVRHLAHHKQNHRSSGHRKFLHFRKFPDAEQKHSVSLWSFCRHYKRPIPVELTVVFKILLAPFSLDVFDHVILQEFLQQLNCLFASYLRPKVLTVPQKLVQPVHSFGS